MNRSFRPALPAFWLSWLFAPLPPLPAETQVTPVEQGLTCVRVSFQTQARPAVLHLLIVDQQKFGFRVLDNGADRKHPRFASLEAAVRREGAIAGTNAGYFTIPGFQPTGLMISQGARTGEFIAHKWPDGILCVRQGMLHLEHRDLFAESPAVTELIQSGPWLIRQGIAQETAGAKEASVGRTFVAAGDRGRVGLGYCDRARLMDLQQILLSRDLQALFQTRDALNLDGGPSSGFVLLSPAATLVIPERWTVRNFLAVIPRQRQKAGSDEER